MTVVAGEGWSDYVNPFSYLAGAAGKVAGDAWTVAGWVVDVGATIAAAAGSGYGHGEGMQWQDDEQGGRGMIATGAQPARAPSTWPGSQAAVDSGWATWVDAEQS